MAPTSKSLSPSTDNPIVNTYGEEEEGLLDKIEITTKRSTLLQASMNLFKGNIGSGILGIPFAFSQSGIWAGMCGMFLISVISIHCASLLINCKRKLQETKDKNFSFGDIGYECFGVFGTRAINVLLTFTQVGFGCSYVIFISNNMHILIPEVKVELWALIILPVLCGLCLFRSFKYLAPFSMLANFSILFGIGVVYAYTFQHMDGLEHTKAYDFKHFPIFFGMAVYCFEGIGLVVPVESSMKKPEKFLNIFYVVMGIVTIMLVSFGAFGYITFGNDINSIITSNLPSHGKSKIMVLCVRGFLSFSLLMTFPVQLFPIFDILEGDLFPPKTAFLETKRNVLRIIIVTLATGVAIGIPHFGLFISLIGCFGSTLLTFIFPCLFHLKLFSEEMSQWRKYKDYGIILFGVIGGVAGGVVTIIELSEEL